MPALSPHEWIGNRYAHGCAALIERLPAALEVSALVRQVAAAGGFAMVIARGDADAGAILAVIMTNGCQSRAYERMPQADGSRTWHLAKREDASDPAQFADYLVRRRQQDSDLWIIELDVPQGERFIGLTLAED